MAAPVAHPRPAQPDRPRDLTLLELVRAVSEVTDDEREVVATVLYLLRSGHVRLCGNFRNVPIEQLY
jgi:hypothetical protein